MPRSLSRPPKNPWNGAGRRKDREYGDRVRYREVYVGRRPKLRTPKRACCTWTAAGGPAAAAAGVALISREESTARTTPIDLLIVSDMVGDRHSLVYASGAHGRGVRGAACWRLRRGG